MFKRFMDVVVALIGFIATLPIMSVVALIVWATMGRPVTFRQRRVGLNGREFNLVKFRTMRDAYDDAGHPLPDELRMTRTGNLLRTSRLDELPELWLVVTGDMSFVGPRPLPRDILADETLISARSVVRPGLTGLAQVSGMTQLSNREKFAVDLLYCQRNGLVLDLHILVRTILVIAGIRRKNRQLIAEALSSMDG